MVYSAAEKNARYMNGQKLEDWGRAAGANSPLGPIKGLAVANSSDKKIFTEADLVKLQEQHPTLYQSAYHGTTIQVRGDELGVPEGADIKEYRKAARAVYRELQKTSAYREDLGEVRFTGAGFGKIFATGADPRKWKLIPRLKDIVEKADYIHRADLNKDRKDDIVAFHWLEADISLDGEQLCVGIQVAEDSKGNKFYNLNQDLESWRKQKEALAGHHKIESGPQTELQDATASDEINISLSEPDGNPLFQLALHGTPYKFNQFTLDHIGKGEGDRRPPPHRGKDAA